MNDLIENYVVHTVSQSLQSLFQLNNPKSLQFFQEVLSDKEILFAIFFRLTPLYKPEIHAFLEGVW